MNGYKTFKAQKSAVREHLAAGGYVMKILDAKEEVFQNDKGTFRKLTISYDVNDGPSKDFFKNDYTSQTGEDKKWHGVFRLSVPEDNDDERASWKKRGFEDAMYAIEASNTGFHWDWDETKLKGKLVGALYRNREWEMDGRTGWTTECCKFVPVEDIKGNKFRMPKDKPLDDSKTANNTASNNKSTMTDLTDVNEDELPF